ncbi:MAG: hypothetical protein ACKVJU_01175 [Verrucomicrobiales bacterium]
MENTKWDVYISLSERKLWRINDTTVQTAEVAFSTKGTALFSKRLRFLDSRIPLEVNVG